MVLGLGGGCQSARDLNELVIVMGIGMDADEEKPDNIKLIAQIVLPEKMSSSPAGGMSSGEGGPYYNLESSAKNTFEAVRGYTHMETGKLYVAHAQVFVIGREIAERGIAPYMDFFVRAKETRPTTKIAISETTAGDVLEVKPTLTLLPATNIEKLVEGQVANSQSKEANVLDYINAMQSSTTSLIAPILRIKERDGEKSIYISGMAVFKKDRMVGELSDHESRGVLWVLGEVQSTVVNVDICGGVASFEVLSAKSEVSPVVSDGKVTMKISVSVTAELSEQTCKENLATQDNIKNLQALVGETICGEIVLAFNKAAALDADVYGFGEMVHKHYNEMWRDMEPNWDKLFPEITLDIKADVAIISAGAIEKPVWVKEEQP
jgi:germination protein, Ger(x)C family